MAITTKTPALSFSNIPKPSLDRILTYLVNQQLNAHTAADGKPVPQQTLHYYILFQYYKNFRLLSRLKSSALCLLKTQYAKKPKNPV